MVRILLCDDDISFLDRLRKELHAILQSHKIGAAINIVSSPFDISKELILSTDIFFLDMDFSGTPNEGLGVARKIRQSDTDAIIIFLTNYIEFAPAGYEVQAFRYLLKSDFSFKLEDCVLSAIRKSDQLHETVQFTVGGEPLTIYLAHILFIEAQGHTIQLNVKKPQASVKQFSLYASLTGIEKQLSESGFLRIQKSYLVNMRRIKSFRCDQVTLDDGTVLPVSEKMYREQKKKYIAWKGRL